MSNRFVFLLRIALLVMCASSELAMAQALARGNVLGCELSIPEIAANRSTCGTVEPSTTKVLCKSDVSGYRVMSMSLSSGISLPTQKVGALPSGFDLGLSITKGLSSGWYNLNLVLDRAGKQTTIVLAFAVDNLPPGIDVVKRGRSASVRVTDSFSRISEATVIVPDGRGFKDFSLLDLSVPNSSEDLPRDKTFSLQVAPPDNSLVFVRDSAGNAYYHRFGGGSSSAILESYSTFLKKQRSVSRSAGALGSSMPSTTTQETPIIAVLYNFAAGLTEENLKQRLYDIQSRVHDAFEIAESELNRNGAPVPGLSNAMRSSTVYYAREVGSSTLKRLALIDGKIVIIQEQNLRSPLYPGAEFVIPGSDKSALPGVEKAESAVVTQILSDAALVNGRPTNSRDRVVSFFDKIGGGQEEFGGFYDAPTQLPIVGVSLAVEAWEGGTTILHELSHSFGLSHVRYVDELYQSYSTPDFGVGRDNLMQPGEDILKTRFTRAQAVLLRARIWGTPSEAASGAAVGSEMKVGVAGTEFWRERELLGTGQGVTPPLTSVPFNRAAFPSQFSPMGSTSAKFPSLLKQDWGCGASFCATVTGAHDNMTIQEDDWEFALPGNIDSRTSFPVVWTKGGSPTSEVVLNRLQPTTPVEIAVMSMSSGIFDPRYHVANPVGSQEDWLKRVAIDTALLELPPSTAAGGSVQIIADRLFEVLSVIAHDSNDLEHGVSPYIRHWPPVDNSVRLKLPQLVAIGYAPSALAPIGPAGGAHWHPNNPSIEGE